MGPEEANRGELEGGRWWWWQGRCRTIKIAAIVLQRFCFVAVKVGAAATVPYGLCGFVLEPVFLLGRYMITCRGCSVVVLHHGILPTIRRCCSRVLPGDFSLKGDGRGPCMATRGSAVCFSLSGCVPRRSRPFVFISSTMNSRIVDAEGVSGLLRADEKS